MKFKRAIVLISFLLPAIIGWTSLYGAMDVSRKSDPVVIRGIHFARMQGQMPESLGLFAYQGRGFAPIPFQIDQRMFRDVYMYRNIYQGLKRVQKILSYEFTVAQNDELRKKDPDPKFDQDDELCFMARDAGGKAPAGAAPAAAVECEEIKLSENDGRDLSYAYLCSFKSSPPLASENYVGIDQAGLNVEGQTYKLGYPQDNIFNFDSLQIKNSGGSGPDILDRFKTRINVGVAFNVTGEVLRDDDFHHYFRGAKIGPVRIIREMESVLESWGNFQIRVYNHVIYYPDHVEMDIESRAALYLMGKSAFELFGGDIDDSNHIFVLDYNDNARGMYFISEKNPEPKLIDGNFTDDEKFMDYGQTEWTAVTGQPGTVMMYLGLGEDKEVYKDLFFTDDERAVDTPEEQYGPLGESGFIIRHLQRVGTNLTPLVLAVYMDPQPYKPGAEKNLVDIYRDPLQVEIGPHAFTATQPTAAAIPETRGGKSYPTAPTVEQEKTTEDIPPFLAPAFILDPYNLGIGPGVSYDDLDFLGSGVEFGFLFLFTERNYYDYKVDFQHMPYLKGVENLRFYIEYQQFPSQSFYGIGNDTRKQWHSIYWWNQLDTFVTFGKFFSDIYGADFKLGYRDVKIQSGQAAVSGEKLPSLEEHFGRDAQIKDDRWGQPVYGMQGGPTSIIEATLFRDMRDNRHLVKIGNYEEIRAELVRKELGSDYNWLRLTTDLRAHWHPDFLNPLPIDSLVSSRRTFLDKFIGEDKNRTLSGRILMSHLVADEIEYQGHQVLDVPFYALNTLGSSTNMGYATDRFRDNDMAALMLEYRWRYWRFEDMALFWNIGAVMPNLFEQQGWDGKWHHSYGISYRIHVPPNVIVTVELAYSDEENGRIYQANVGF